MEFRINSWTLRETPMPGIKIAILLKIYLGRHTRRLSDKVFTSNRHKDGVREYANR